MLERKKYCPTIHKS